MKGKDPAEIRAAEELEYELNEEISDVKANTSVQTQVPADMKVRMLIRLKYDKVTMKEFLRCAIEDYTNMDPLFYDWWEYRREKVSKISRRWQKKMREMRKKGQTSFEDFAPSDQSEGESIFDFLIKEFGE